MLLIVLTVNSILSYPGNMVVSAQIPPVTVPVYSKLKELFIEIPLVIDGNASCYIVTPSCYDEAAEIIQTVIANRTGVRVPVVSDSDSLAATPFRSNLIILGNRSTSRISNELYDRFYSLMDLKYPGPGGYAVRSLHNPYGNGYSAILVGGSDPAGVNSGAVAFAAELESLPASEGNLKAGWTMLTKLGEGVIIPVDIKQFETWEASKSYGSVGYFGWNSISKRMAMYYMTGNPFHAREVIRLSFPNAQAMKEIDEIDGERIENKKDPLAGPYHYNATMTVLFWDLIEESPAFSDAERLNVTNAFARRIDHEGTTPYDKTTYKINAVPSSVGSRHAQWSALSLYTLGRYFSKYYPSPMWSQAERAGKLAFGSMHNHAWVSGESDNLYWYCTAIAPVLTYMVLTGDRKPLENGVLQQLLEGQEVLVSGLIPDWALNYAALDFLNKAAYLTGDGRWVNYRERTGVNTDIFRLGQSFWPDGSIIPSPPEDLTGKWLVNPLPFPMWQARKNGFTLEQSFQNMSYRSAANAAGDFILLDGYNGASRNPYHTFAILELRLDGATLLKGYNNQVITSVDGMVNPVVPMDGAILFHDVVGQVAMATGEVPLSNWKRSLFQRTGKYSLIIDEIGVNNNSAQPGSNNILSVETSWEMPGAAWIPEHNFIRIQPSGASGQGIFQLHSSHIMDVKSGPVTAMKWKGTVENGKPLVLFHLLGLNKTGSYDGLASLRLTENAAALALPEAAVAVSGEFREVKGNLVILGEKTLSGHSITKAGLNHTIMSVDFPVETDWNFEEGAMTLVTSREVNLTLSLKQPVLTINGITIAGQETGELYSFHLDEGRYQITGALPKENVIQALSDELKGLLLQGRQIRVQELSGPADNAETFAPGFTPAMSAKVGTSPSASTVIAVENNEVLCVASGRIVTWIGSDGSLIRILTATGNVRVLHWWERSRLLLVGCDDERVIAYDEWGNLKWTFTSVMDPAVYEAGKDYWFKSAYPGIYGLYSGIFDNNMNRAFVGSACTLEVLDDNGKLVKRLPVFWGNGTNFLIVNASDGTKNLLIGRWPNDWVTMAVINSRNIEDKGRGYSDVPPGNTFINGWTAMNRYDNFLADIDNDGKREVISAINGTWNRVTIYTEDGKPLYNAQFGPGVTTPRANIRMMDVSDLDNNDKKEIIVALSSGIINVLDHQANKLWAKTLASPPMVLKSVKGECGTWLCIACEDGTVLAMDGSGNIKKKGMVTGKPTGIQIMQTSQGPMAVIITDKGVINGFRLFCPEDIKPEKGEMLVFPNPVSDVIEMLFPYDYRGYIEIYSERGQLVLSQKSVGRLNRISTQGIQNGIYFIHARDGSKLYSKKVIIIKGH